MTIFFRIGLDFFSDSAIIRIQNPYIQAAAIWRGREVCEKMKNKTLRNDLIVIVILFLIIGGLFFFKSRKQGQLIEITKDNQIYGYYSLNEDQIIKIDQENTIQIKNQKVKMIQATCPDHLCIKQGTIDKKGSTIVCLPHHLIIEIKEGKEEVQDGKVY